MEHSKTSEEEEEGGGGGGGGEKKKKKKKKNQRVNICYTTSHQIKGQLMIIFVTEQVKSNGTPSHTESPTSHRDILRHKEK